MSPSASVLCKTGVWCNLYNLVVCVVYIYLSCGVCMKKSKYNIATVMPDRFMLFFRHFLPKKNKTPQLRCFILFQRPFSLHSAEYIRKRRCLLQYTARQKVTYCASSWLSLASRAAILAFSLSTVRGKSNWAPSSRRGTAGNPR